MPLAHWATQLPALEPSTAWYEVEAHEVQLLAERSQVRHEASQARQLPPLSYRPCGGHVRNVRAREQAGSRGSYCWVT